jgi:cytochrome P450
VIHTCDPEVSTQIFRRSEFTKPVELIELLNVFGPGLTGSEGAEGRLYRKVTAPFFTEQTVDQVWRTSIESVETFMQSVVASQASKKSNRRGLRSMVASMTLHIVFTVCFGTDVDKKSPQLQETSFIGHKTGFYQTVLSSLDHIATIAFMPKFILG